MSKRQEKDRAKKQRRWEAQNKNINDFKVVAPHMKRLLRAWGCDLPFYDFLDSYAEKFQQLGNEALAKHRSLRAINEVDDATYRSRDWSKLGYGDLRQARIHIDDKYDGDYGLFEKNANLCGAAAIFHDAEGRLITGVIIRQTVKGWLEHREFKYVTKNVALLHEIGHVHDIENGINFHVEGDDVRVDIIEAEVFANLFALEKLAEAHLRQSYVMMVDALQKHTKKPGFISEVCKLVLERLPQRQLVDWQDVRANHKFTEADLAILGKDGYEAIQRMS